jgi:hypothetical protein
VLEKCPDCFQVRATIMNSLTPKWGGSYELMESFAARSAERDNPRMKLLAGFILVDQYQMKLIGLEGLQRALALGDYWVFYAHLANAQARTNPRAARAAAQRAAELRPLEPLVVDAQLHAAVGVGAWEEAAQLWSLGNQLDPTLEGLATTRDILVQQLPALARARAQEGSPRQALTLFEVLTELSPRDARLRAERDALRGRLDGGH